MEPVELYLYDQIGPDWAGMVSAPMVVRALKEAADRPVRVRINSPGGDVFEGQAIYNALLRHGPGVDVEIDSLAASAASLIAMAGKTIRIAENARVMIHRAWTMVAGNVADLLAAVDLLKGIDTTMADTYAARTKQTREQVQAWLDAETWMTAQEAVDRGFADEIGQRLNVKACTKGLKNLPQWIVTWDDATTAGAEAAKPPQPPTRQASLYSPEHVARVIDLRKRALL
jgi:ATP-dependent Clp protease, protease subunit